MLNANGLKDHQIITHDFDFIEMSSTKPDELEDFLQKMGFSVVAKHKERPIYLYRQGLNIARHSNIIVNFDASSHAQDFAKKRDKSVISAMSFTTNNAQKTLEQVVSRGAQQLSRDKVSTLAELPVLWGPGDTLIYLTDPMHQEYLYKDFFFLLPGMDPYPSGIGLHTLDHITCNHKVGELDKWIEYFQHVFDFTLGANYEIHFNKTRYQFSWLSNANGHIRLPMNEPRDNVSTVSEFIRQNKGTGMQHVAFQTEDIYKAVRSAQENGIAFLPTPDTYYEVLNERLPGHNQDLQELKRLNILMDGRQNSGEYHLLLQIFTKMLIPPVFFEIIYRKGEAGFGEGNVEALSKALELDQIRRGVL